MSLSNRAGSSGIFVGALAAALLAGCTGESDAGSGDEAEFPEEALTTVTSDDGALSLEVRTAPMQPPSRGSIHVGLAIRGADGEPRGIWSLRVVPWMTDMAHGASKEPPIEVLGDGLYELGPVDMFMSGRWELRTTIDGPVEDSASIVFEIPEASAARAAGSEGARAAARGRWLARVLRLAGVAAWAGAVSVGAPQQAWGQACCAGATALGTTRLAPHEDAVVGVSARAFTLFGSVRRDGAYVGAPAETTELGFEQSVAGTLRVLKHGQLTVSVPVVETYRKVPGLAEVGGGLGDVLLGARYDFVEPGALPRWPGIALALSLALPTGRAPEEATSPLATDATGTGGAAAGADLFLERGYGDWFVQLVGSGLWRAPRSVLGLRSQRGLTFSGLAAGGYSFANGLVGAVTVSYRAELDGRLDGAAVPGSGHGVTRGGLAAGLPLSDDWRLQGAVFADVPVSPLSRNQPMSTGVSVTLLRSAW